MPPKGKSISEKPQSSDPQALPVRGPKRSRRDCLNDDTEEKTAARSESKGEDKESKPTKKMIKKGKDGKGQDAVEVEKK
jgi:hypothetical protein